MSRPTLTIVSVNLPLPPSVNDAFAARRGSHLLMRTAAYHSWLRAVKDEYGDAAQLPVLLPGKCAMWLSLPDKMRGDIDGRVKLVFDVLEPTGLRKDKYGLGVIENDGRADALFVERGGAPPDRVIATVTTLAAWPSYVEMRML